MSTRNPLRTDREIKFLPVSGWAMHHPSVSRSSRSPHHSLAASPSPAPSPLPSPGASLSLPHNHQQQPHILYGPITTLQPSTTPPHPSCIYPTNQRGNGSSSPSPLHSQGKSSKWHGKAKVPRGQQCHAQPARTTHFSYTGKPMVLFDQTQPTTPASTASFLVSSSTFAHGQFPPINQDHYNNSGVALIPPPYFKPPDVQTFCLLQDRQQTPQHNSYYNISATNTCSLQAVNANSSFQMPSLAPYTMTAFSNNQITTPIPVQSTQIFQTAPISLVFGPPPRENHTALGITTATKSVKHNISSSANIKSSAVSCVQNNEWLPSIRDSISTSAITSSPTTATPSTVSVVFDTSSKSTRSTPQTDPSISKTLKASEERYSDESSASFDFTIEAEKMVSALCNTASTTDLSGAFGKEDGHNKQDSNYFNGAGDNVANKGSWFADFEMDYSNGGGGSCQSTTNQTRFNQIPSQQLPELIRKTAYWGCSEAESILNSSRHPDPKEIWLSNISSATRTAITKSSTCFPVFSGERTFVQDLINAHLRISNSWLILDNYLNKQHYPIFVNKIDAELTRCFQVWEESTYELLRNVIQTFLKLDKTILSNYNATPRGQNETPIGTFPGDVSAYTNFDLFALLTHTKSHEPSEKNVPSATSSLQADHESAYAIHYTPRSSDVQNFRCFNAQTKETKPRSKWTITENLPLQMDPITSVPDVAPSYTESGVHFGKFHTKSAAASKHASGQSLNAEFFSLKNKVMESNRDPMKSWKTNLRKSTTLLSGAKIAMGVEPVHNLQSPTGFSSGYTAKTSNATYENFGTGQSSQAIDAVYQNSVASAASVCLSGSPTRAETNVIGKVYPDFESESKSLNCVYHNYASTSSGRLDSIHARTPLNDQPDSSVVPKTKMTLLSQIEPSGLGGKGTEEMTANLTAWFASMRTSNSVLCPTSTGTLDSRSSETIRTSYHHEHSRSAMDLNRQLQMDTNRQLRALNNMKNTQNAPWNARNLMNGRSNGQQVEEYDSSEDVRVYMKPGSYNVPRKRHQKRANCRRSDNCTVSGRNVGGNMAHKSYGGKDKGGTSRGGTTIKLEFSATPISPSSYFSLTNSARATKRVKSSSSREFSQDVTWKAACASAEILLEALNVKGDEIRATQVSEIPTGTDSKSKSQDEGASSYEASEDDSGSTCKRSSTELQSRENKSSKINVKTDSWLIRTLNNAGKQQSYEPERDSSESFNSSMQEDDAIATDDTSKKVNDDCASQKQEPIDEEQRGNTSETIARATYSETVRRCASGTGIKEFCKPQDVSVTTFGSCNMTIQPSSRKSQRKESSRSFSGHKSRKSSGKRLCKDADHVQNDEELPRVKILKEEMSQLPTVKSHFKRKDGISGVLAENGKNKTGDRGWSVWYSSRRKQSLSSMASRKLELIHETVCKMDEAEIFKYPSSSSLAVHLSTETNPEYFKGIKGPMFLETIGYKLKNHIYHKVEHVIRDFRKIVYNSRLYHKNDAGRLANVEVISKKLENLFTEHFTNWDFENVTGSPRDGNGSPVSSRHKIPIQKTIRSTNTKKSPIPITNTENSPFH